MSDEEKERVNLIKKLIEEAEQLLSKGDTIQSSEKLYKAVEEGIKLLAKRYNLEEARIANERGRWSVSLLDSAVEKLTEKIGDIIDVLWAIAYDKLHIDGFHEGKLTVKDVDSGLKEVKKLLKIIENYG